jgi:pimeloyl-ACP methyl ester carboxylesterase
MWQGHIEALPDFHCLAPDLPGHGRSRDVPWASRADTADRVIKLIEGLPERRAHVVGLSLGGSVALEIMARRSEVLDHVVIDGCGAIGTRLAILMKLGVTAVSPFIRRPVVGRLVAKAIGITDPIGVDDLLGQFRQVDPRSFRRAFSDAQDVRIDEALLRSACPTLLVAGERELAVVRGSNRLLGDVLPRAESRMFPGAGHGWLGTAPDVHVAMVRAWITDQPAPCELVPETIARPHVRNVAPWLARGSEQWRS